MCVEPTLKKRVAPLILQGNRLANFLKLLRGYPPINLGLTFLVTRQCGEDVLKADKISACYSIRPDVLRKLVLEEHQAG